MLTVRSCRMVLHQLWSLSNLWFHL